MTVFGCVSMNSCWRYVISWCSGSICSVRVMSPSVLIGEMTVESEVQTDILIQDLVMTNRTDITHNTVEGIMTE